MMRTPLKDNTGCRIFVSIDSLIADFGRVRNPSQRDGRQIVRHYEMPISPGRPA